MTSIMQKYFQAWIDADINAIQELFCKDVIYSECYGPEYHGMTQINQWFDSWNKKGRVLEWTIKRTIEHDKTIVVEWYFKCNYEGKTEGFDGVTIADFDNDGKIASLKEFQSKSDHVCPYGE